MQKINKSATSRSEYDSTDDTEFSPEERRAMLEDIARVALSIGNDAGVRLDVSLDYPIRRDTQSRIERIRLLEALWPEVAAVFQVIHRQPDTLLMLQKRPSSLPLSHGSSALAFTVACTPHLAAAWRHPASSHPSSPASYSSGLEEPHHAPSTATSANRFAAQLLDTLIREATALAKVSDYCEEKAEARSMQTLARQAQAQRRSDLLRDLPSLPWAECARLPTSDTTLRFAPAYRTLFQTWRRLNAAFHFDWSTLPLVSFSAQQTWRIYEIWCFLQIVDSLRQAGWRMTTPNDVRIVESGLRLELAKGRPSCLRFVRESARTQGPPLQESRNLLPASNTSIDLYYQPLYPSANQSRARDLSKLRSKELPKELPIVAANAAPNRPALSTDTPCFVSTSHAMQPDIALRLGDRLYLLDPKFRGYAEPGEEQDDINKMHAYRDAIHMDAVGTGESRPAVRAAVCLFPGQSRFATCPSAFPDAALLPPEQALRSYPAPTSAQPFGTAPVGAVRLRPGEKNAAIWVRHLLSQWLDNTDK